MADKVTEVVTQVMAAGQKHNALVVKAMISPGNHTPVASFSDTEIFLEILDQVRPQLIYLSEDIFDSEQDVFTSLKIRPEDEDEEAIDPKIRNLIKIWSGRNGVVAEVYAAVMHEGILHTLTVTEEWINQFYDEIDVLKSDLDLMQRQGRASERRAERHAMHAKAKQLAANPIYAAPKSSKAKRQYLAAEMFPDLPEFEIDQIVEIADSVVWVRDNTPRSGSAA